jgi:APA family basic amino acid/polyamine antiporter
MAEEKLERKLGLFPATNIVVANMIGAGIFTTSGLLMSGLNDPVLMLILWAVGGILHFMSPSYGEWEPQCRVRSEYLFLSNCIILFSVSERLGLIYRRFFSSHCGFCAWIQ